MLGPGSTANAAGPGDDGRQTLPERATLTLSMGTGPARRRIRIGAGLIAGICVLLLATSALAAPVTPAIPGEPDPTLDAPDQPPGSVGESGGPADGSLTVVSTQGFYLTTHPGARDAAELIAFDADGSVVYHDHTYDVYFDVDPVPGTRYTVEYVAAERLGGDACETDPCSRNLVERVNLSTGAVTRVYDAVTPQYDTGRWHDVDRLNETHLVVADIVYDRVFVVDTRTDEIAWQWNASDHYATDAGGGSGDWTHVNDVEGLDDGRIMAGMRNMDEVVFIDPATGVDDDWTLGADDDHDVLYEPHNPDFIPFERGGPAVVIADSENNRIVEYQRVDGDWTRAWSWRDPTLQWPRDADRLPNGNTLVVDSHGDRVVEVGTDGTVVWSVDIGRPYDAERLGTRDESAGGHAAGTAPGSDGAAAPPAVDQGSAGGILVTLKDVLPSVLVNGLLFVAPPWVGFTDLLVAAVLLVDLLVWGGLEWQWSRHTIAGVRRRQMR